MSGNDKILPVTRLLAALVLPFLLLAFLILYFVPDQSGQRFAWAIQPPMTALFMGAGYLGGAYLFFRTLIGRRWHPVAAGYPAITVFTVTMLGATLLHWERFQLNHFPFLLWLGLYAISPIAVPWIWWRNRPADPGQPDRDDVMVPLLARGIMAAIGLTLLMVALAGFVRPAWLVGFWPWPLTPLTARVLCGWFALMGVGGLVIAPDRRWSAWQVPLGSIALWHGLVLVAAYLRPADFHDGRWLNWYTVSVAIVLLGILSLTLWLEGRRRATRRLRPAPG